MNKKIMKESLCSPFFTDSRDRLSLHKGIYANPRIPLLGKDKPQFIVNSIQNNFLPKFSQNY